MGCMSSKSAADAPPSSSASEPLLSGKQEATKEYGGVDSASSAPSTSPEKGFSPEKDSNPTSGSSPAAPSGPSFTSPLARSVKDGSPGIGSPALRNGRQVPGVLLTGGEFISIGNTAVSSLLVRNIGQFSAIHKHYSSGAPAMSKADLQRCLSEYSVMPSWLSAEELDVIFNAVRGPSDTPSASLGLDSGGLNECLARVALFYAPDSGANFDMSMEDLSQSTQFADLFIKLLDHMDEHKPASVDHATFTTKRKPRRRGRK